MTLRKIGLAFLALTISMAISGVGIARAIEGPTSLCKAEEEVCNTLNQYAVGTGLGTETRASPTEGAKLTTNLGTVVCDSSMISRTTGSATTASAALPGEITTLTFTNCQIAGEPCTVKNAKGQEGVAENLPYSSRIATEGTFNKGSLIAKSGGGGNPGLSILCGELINCTYTVAEPKLTFVGGVSGVANAKASAIALSFAGGKCTKTATWTATYFLVSPTPVYLSM